MIDTKRLYTIEDLETILDSLPCSIYIKDKKIKKIINLLQIFPH